MGWSTAAEFGRHCSSWKNPACGIGWERRQKEFRPTDAEGVSAAGRRGWSMGLATAGRPRVSCFQLRRTPGVRFHGDDKLHSKLR